MVYKVQIKNNKKAPIRYLLDLPNFKNGKEYTFKAGVNIIVGENGCGKTTLLNLIRSYLLVDKEECSKGMYNSNINKLFASYKNEEILDGVDVFADYRKNTFRLCHLSEKDGDDAMKSFNSFGVFFEQNQSSTGESVRLALAALFNSMYSKDAHLTFDYGKFKNDYPLYADYVEKHRMETTDEYTILMDEPDRNLDVEIIGQVKGILSYHKPQTQIIAVVHNPLLIYSLSHCEEVNFIEMTKGYIKKVCKMIDNLIKQ